MLFGYSFGPRSVLQRAMKPNTIFITGGSGYIGTHLVVRLAKAKKRLIVFDREPLSQSLRTYAHFIRGDIRNFDDVRKAFVLEQPNTVMHLAALTRVVSDASYLHDQWTTNVDGSRNVLRAMKETGCPHIVFASSAAVYRGNDSPISEASDLAPISEYGRTKKMAEDLVLSEATKGHIRAVILRPFNVAGNNSSIKLHGGYEQKGALIPTIVSVLRNQRPFLHIYGQHYLTKDGTAVRDYTHVSDVVEALYNAIEYIQRKKKIIVINIGSNIGTTNLEIVRAFERLLKRSVPIRFDAPRPNEIVCSVANNGLAQQTLHWKPENSDIQTIIRSVCRYYGLI